MSAVFSQNLRRVDFQDFFCLLQFDRLQLTVVCCNRRGVKTTPQKTIFAVWIYTRNSCTGQKVNKFGALTSSEFVTQNDKSNNMLNDLKHVETHECEEKLTWFKSSSQFRTLDRIDGDPTQFEWNISQDSPHCSLSVKSKSSCRL